LPVSKNTLQPTQQIVNNQQKIMTLTMLNISEDFWEEMQRRVDQAVKSALEEHLKPPIKHPPRNSLLTKSEAARFLGVSTRTIDNYRKQGLIEAIRIGGKVIRFKVEELESFQGSAATG